MLLITNCHVSEKWNLGPTANQAATSTPDNINAQGDPALIDTFSANLRNASFISVSPQLLNFLYADREDAVVKRGIKEFTPQAIRLSGQVCSSTGQRAI
jgi:hypothetical protein